MANTIYLLWNRLVDRSNNLSVRMLDLADGSYAVATGSYGFDGTAWHPLTTDATGKLQVSLPTPSTFTTGLLVDHSGSITTGGTAQQAIPSDTTRQYFYLENTSANDLWWSLTAVNPHVAVGRKLIAGANYETRLFVSTQALYIWGATTGQTYTLMTA